MQTWMLFFVFAVLLSFNGNAFNLSGRAQVSIITCAPGNQMYSVYGHSAIRVFDPAYNYDVVFNYGIFDFSSPNFLYRFCAGQTDYLLGAYRFDSFLEEYEHDKRSVYEQKLIISPEEKQKIVDFLLWNAKPENRVYRYNFFFDNCATRIRDVVADHIDGGIEYCQKSDGKTLRTLIKDYHGRLKWLDFGIDFLISSEADRLVTLEEEMFLPDYVMKQFAAVQRKSNGEKIAGDVKVLYQAPESKASGSWLSSPAMVTGLLLLLVLIFTIKQFRKQKLNTALDIVLFGVNGLGGLLVLWFTIYSEHPAMNANYNLLWLVPVNFVFAIIWSVKRWQKVTSYYFPIFSGWLFLFLLFSFFSIQKFHPCFFLMAAMVLVRSLAHSILLLKKSNK